MPMYNLIGYSDNYSDTSGSLWQFKRGQIDGNVNLTANNSLTFQCKSNLIGNTEADGANNRKKEGVKIGAPRKYLSNFWRSLEMPLSNCKVVLLLEWKRNFMLSTEEGAILFIIIDSKLYFLIVTLSMQDNAKLSKVLCDLFIGMNIK